MFRNRWRAVLHTIKRGTIPSILVALLWTFYIAFAGASPALAFAHTTSIHPTRVVRALLIVRPGATHGRHISGNSHNGTTSPFLSVDQCLNEFANITSPADNTADALGATANNCLATVSGTQFMSLTNQCVGVGKGGNLSKNFSQAVGTEFVQDVTVNAGCVECENGVAVGFPPFVLSLRVTALGAFTFRGRPFQAQSDVATDSVEVSNNGQFASACS